MNRTEHAPKCSPLWEWDPNPHPPQDYIILGTYTFWNFLLFLLKRIALYLLEFDFDITVSLGLYDFFFNSKKLASMVIVIRNYIKESPK
jgi:hypothetical protein